MEIIKGAYGVLMYKVKFELATGYQWRRGVITPINGSMKDGVTYTAFYFPRLNKRTAGAGNEEHLNAIHYWYITAYSDQVQPIITDGKGSHIVMNKDMEEDILPLATGIIRSNCSLKFGVVMTMGKEYDDTAVELTGFLVPQPIS